MRGANTRLTGEAYWLVGIHLLPAFFLVMDLSRYPADEEKIYNASMRWNWNVFSSNILYTHFEQAHLPTSRLH